MEAALMSRTVDRTIEDLDKAMRELRRTLRGIPFRGGGFKNTHDNLARDVAHLTVLIDSARAAFNK
jgi:ABC-type transporter Mla subunit MlaD